MPKSAKPRKTAAAAAVAAATAPAPAPIPLQAPADVSASPLAADQSAFFTDAGHAYAVSALAEGRRDAELADHFKACATVAQWEAASLAFRAGAQRAGYANPADLLFRTLQRLRHLNLIGEKPKATSADATRVAEARKKAAALPSGTVAEHRTKQVALVREAGKIAAKLEKLPDGKAKQAAQSEFAKLHEQAAAAGSAAAKLEKAAATAAAEAAKKAVSEAKEALRARVKAIADSGDLATIRAALAALDKVRIPNAPAVKAAA